MAEIASNNDLPPTSVEDNLPIHIHEPIDAEHEDDGGQLGYATITLILLLIALIPRQSSLDLNGGYERPRAQHSPASPGSGTWQGSNRRRHLQGPCGNKEERHVS